MIYLTFIFSTTVSVILDYFYFFKITELAIKNKKEYIFIGCTLLISIYLSGLLPGYFSTVICNFFIIISFCILFHQYLDTKLILGTLVIIFFIDLIFDIVFSIIFGVFSKTSFNIKLIIDFVSSIISYLLEF